MSARQRRAGRPCLRLGRAGEEEESSDFDFLVTLEQGRSLLDLARLEERLERLLGRRVEVVTEEGLKEPIRSAALREAIRV